MTRIRSLAAAVLPFVVLLACQAEPGDEITAALPVIPDTKFVLTDYGAVGNYKAFDTDAFKKAIAAIAFLKASVSKAL